jgi:hypothetical protein
MKEQIKKEIIRAINNESNIDEVVNNIVGIIESYKNKQLAEKIEMCDCGFPKSFAGGICKDPNCKNKINFKISEQ